MNHYPGKTKKKHTLVGGPRDGETAYFAKSLKIVDLNVQARDLSIDSPVPAYAKATYVRTSPDIFTFEQELGNDERTY
jgi:hypothetical protein